jgi:histidine triad (HIT) family protein
LSREALACGRWRALAASRVMADSIFGKIARGELKADLVYQDDRAVAFRDIHPQAPTHILVIPRQPIPRLSASNDGDSALLGHLLCVARKVAAEQGLADFRLVVNDGPDAGQTVFHLHVHLLGGRPFGWPPG